MVAAAKVRERGKALREEFRSSRFQKAKFPLPDESGGSETAIPKQRQQGDTSDKRRKVRRSKHVCMSKSPDRPCARFRQRPVHRSTYFKSEDLSGFLEQQIKCGAIGVRIFSFDACNLHPVDPGCEEELAEWLPPLCRMSRTTVVDVVGLRSREGGAAPPVVV